MMNFRILFLSLFSFLFLTFSTASAQQSPEDFVVSLMKEANDLSKLSEDTREQALLNLVRRGFDIPTVGKFVLGRYWRKATPEQRAAFLDVFEKAAVRSFTPLLGKIPLDSFKIVRVEYKQYKRITDIIVFSTIEPEKDNIIKIHWRLRLAYSLSAYKIIDITAEGVSLIVTMRAEYTTFIRRNGGIDSLIAELRKKANEKR